MRCDNVLVQKEFPLEGMVVDFFLYFMALSLTSSLSAGSAMLVDWKRDNKANRVSLTHRQEMAVLVADQSRRAEMEGRD